MNEHITIAKKPSFRESEDYVLLRKKGIELIEKLGSTYWTDYNIHDPGITLLELLCFAQTEVGFKLRFDIEDLLAYRHDQSVNWDEQCFFTARTILTVNPFTDNDWRKVVIDQAGIANAWLTCAPCLCHPPFYVDCKESELTYEETEHPIQIQGFWDTLLELSVDSQYGDLNGGKIFYAFSFNMGNHRATAEVRFDPWYKMADNTALLRMLKANDIKTLAISVTTAAHVDLADSVLYKAVRHPLKIDVTYEITDGTDTVSLALSELPVKIWFRSEDGRDHLALTDILGIFEDVGLTGPLSQYLYQLQKADEAVENARTALHAHRNLAEDFCKVTTVPTIDVGICADIEMTPDADIEAVLGEAYYLITEYLNPVVKFYTLGELISDGTYTEEIFNGPGLIHGFILNEELDNSNLKSTLYASDVINILMDIDGITAVKNFVLTRYDDTGKLVESQPWELHIPNGHQPRLYIYGSKVLVFKDDLPFLPQADELHDTLQMWKGIRQQNKVEQSVLDLEVPTGTYIEKDTYYPMQYQLPETYGVGPHGLKEPTTPQRKAQARQLKAYLLIFEHLLAVYLKQLDNFKQLLSINPVVSKTYFGTLFTDNELKKVADLYSDIDDVSFHELLEKPSEFLERRNGFLDHLLARFAESFSDYALMLYQAYGTQEKASEELIFDKINFLEKFPSISANRARAFNYKDESMVCHPENTSGLGERIKVLLGLNGLHSFITYSTKKMASGTWNGFWTLHNDLGEVLLESIKITDAEGEYELRTLLKQSVEEAIALLEAKAHLFVNPQGSDFEVELRNTEGNTVAVSAQVFSPEADAESHKNAIEDFIDKIVLGEKVFVVEHLMLRPRVGPPAGDSFLPICVGKDCQFCGEEDPYSFRITVVLNGEQGVSNSGIAFRKFAEKTIRMETPAHLGVKICWVSEEQLEQFETVYCDWLSELTKAEPNATDLSTKLTDLIDIFKNLKSVYPQATLHDCVDGDDENRVRLNNTII